MTYGDVDKRAIVAAQGPDKPAGNAACAFTAGGLPFGDFVNFHVDPPALRRGLVEAYPNSKDQWAFLAGTSRIGPIQWWLEHNATVPLNTELVTALEQQQCNTSQILVPPPPPPFPSRTAVCGFCDLECWSTRGRLDESGCLYIIIIGGVILIAVLVIAIVFSARMGVSAESRRPPSSAESGYASVASTEPPVVTDATGFATAAASTSQFRSISGSGARLRHILFGSDPKKDE